MIRGTDHAIWRRLRLVPFNVTVPEYEQDKKLPEKLREELPGILAWAVRGCLDWQQDGLGNPDEVKAATADYRSEQDMLGGFLEECCTLAPNCKAKASDLLAAYHEWTGDKHVSQQRLGKALIERGFQRHTSNGGWYLGIGLNTE